MKNKVGLIISALVLVGLLVACGNKAKGTSSSTSKDKDETTLKVGIEGTFPPFNYHDDKDNLTGFEVELAKEIAKKLGRKIEFVETKWDSLIAGLDVNKYDVVFNNVAITEERLATYDFSTPYIYSKATLAVKEDSDIQTLADFKGKKSSQTVSSNFAVDAEGLGAEIVPTDGFAQSIELVTGNRADGTINDEVTFLTYQAEKPDNQIRLIDEEISITEIAAVFNKEQPELKKSINDALAELVEEGVTTKLSVDFFGKDITKK